MKKEKREKNMKKLLGILASAGLVVSTSAVLVSCDSSQTKKTDVKISEIRNEILKDNDIQNLKDTKEVKQILDEKIKNSIEGSVLKFVNSFEVEFWETSDTDVLVTVIINDKIANLVGHGNYFTIQNAIKAKTKINVQDIQTSLQNEASIKDATNIDDLNTKLDTYLKSNPISGVTKLTAAEITGTKDVTITIEFNSDIYVLDGNNGFTLNGVIA